MLVELPRLEDNTTNSIEQINFEATLTFNAQNAEFIKKSRKTRAAHISGYIIIIFLL